jgi:hypothetical protein
VAFVTSLVMTSGFGDQLVGLVTSSGHHSFQTGHWSYETGHWSFETGQGVKETGHWSFETGQGVKETGHWSYETGHRKIYNIIDNIIFISN